MKPSQAITEAFRRGVDHPEVPSHYRPGSMEYRAWAMGVDHARRNRSGLREWRRSRGLRTLIGLYRTAEAGLDDDPDARWATMCENHGYLVLHRTKDQARRFLGHPEAWCAECRTLEEEGEGVLTARPT